MDLPNTRLWRDGPRQMANSPQIARSESLPNQPIEKEQGIDAQSLTSALPYKE
jgi:hypothetical protein